jgi:YHS domain-containing protein
MPSTADQPDLIDPMCGMPVSSSSPHRYAHGGVLFCFCSEPCRERFMVNPSKYAVIAALERAGVQLPSGANSDPQSAIQSSRFWSQPPTWGHTEGGDGQSDVIAGPLPGTVVRTEARGLFALLLAWRERRFAAACCREMLRLHGAAVAADRGLTGPGLYRRVLTMRRGADPATVDDVLRNAEQSFAIWPVARALKFRDVVHYLAVSEFVSSYDGTPWVHVNMKRVVESMVPHDL